MKFLQLQATRVLLAVGLATSALSMLPTPSLADSIGSDAAIGAAIGSLVGQLLFDSGRQQYYYIDDDRRRYVSNEEAWRYRHAFRDNDYHYAYARHDDYRPERDGWHDERRGDARYDDHADARGDRHDDQGRWHRDGDR